MIKVIENEILKLKNPYTNELIDKDSFINSIKYDDETNKAILDLKYLGEDGQKNKLLNREITKKLKIDLKIKGVKFIYNDIKQRDNDFKDIKVIAVSSTKGGVGKSQVSFNLASLLSKKGYESAIVDADILGYSIAKIANMYGKLEQKEGKIKPLVNKDGLELISAQSFIENNENRAIAWRGNIFNQLLEKFFLKTKYSDDLEYLIIDLPPGTGDTFLNLSSYFDHINLVLVTTPNEDSSHVSLRMVEVAKDLNFNILGIVNNMAYYEFENVKHYILGKYDVSKYARENNINFLGDIPLKGEDKYFADDYLNNYYERILDNILASKIEVN